MGRFNELLNTGAQMGRGFGILLGLQEQEGITTVAPELMPVLDADGSAERAATVGYTPLWGQISGLAAGGVGFRSQIAIDNPAGSGQVLILEKVRLSTAVSEVLIVAWSPVQLTGSTGNLLARDSRMITTAGFTGPSSARIRTQNNAALSGTSSVDIMQSILNDPHENELGAVIAPGHSLRFFPTADNTAINSNITFFAKSRQLNPRELFL